MQSYQFILYKGRVSPSTKKTINNKIVDLGKQLFILGGLNWNNHRMDEVCPLIKEWKVEWLYLSKYVWYEVSIESPPMILRIIKEVRFPNLKIIFLSQNKIESVEGLNKINLP